MLKSLELIFNYKTTLKRNTINLFEKETEICQKLSKENKDRRGWGKRKDCGQNGD